MNDIYTQIANTLTLNGFEFSFEESEKTAQFRLSVEFENFVEDAKVFIYVSKDELLLTIVFLPVQHSLELYALINKWNSESLFFKTFLDEETKTLTVESFHAFVSEDKFSSLLQYALEQFIKELNYYQSIKNYFLPKD